MAFITIALSILAIGFAVYHYLLRNMNFFKKRGIFCLPPVPIVGNMGSVMFYRKSLADLVIDMYNINPEAKYVGFYDFSSPVIVLRDLDLIKSVAIKHFESFPDHRGFGGEDLDPLFGKNLFSIRGERWKVVRNLLSPAFTSSKMKSMFKLMANCAADFGKYISELPEEKRVMDMKDVCARYTNDVIGTCAFGVTINSLKDPKNDFYVYGREATDLSGFRGLKLFLLRNYPFLAKLFNMSVIPNRCANFFRHIISDNIKTRDEQGIVRPDMIQLMMESRGKMEPGMELSIDDMVSQAFIFFFGGFDTVSTSMCFTAFTLAENQDCQRKLQAEIDKVMGETNGQLTYEAVTKMEYLDAVVNESLRMYPVAVFLDRMCTERFELPPAVPGAKPFTVEKDMNVWIPVYGLQHDPKYFENPEKFDPERFLENSKAIANSGAFIPFGLGPRMCIGNRFALMEMKVLLCHILARCDLKVSPRTITPMRFRKSGFNILPEGGFWLKVVPREKPHPVVRNGVANGTR